MTAQIGTRKIRQGKVVSVLQRRGTERYILDLRCVTLALGQGRRRSWDSPARSGVADCQRQSTRNQATLRR